MNAPRPDRHLFCFGCGYTAQRLARRVQAQGGQVSGTARTAQGVKALNAKGITGWQFDGTAPIPAAALQGVTEILISIPPGDTGDMILPHHPDLAAICGNLRWVGLLSTTGVYGDTGGAWIGEDAALAPRTQRSRNRVLAEGHWRDFATQSGTPVQIFRLPGIYGPHRSPFARLRAGTARRIVKPGQVFNRIHVDDIAAALLLGMARPDAGPIFHLADGHPAPADEVTSHAAALIGATPPPEVAVDDPSLSPMAREFYGECKRLDITRARRELGFAPIYPDYRSGLQAILDEELAEA